MYLHTWLPPDMWRAMYRNPSKPNVLRCSAIKWTKARASCYKQLHINNQVVLQERTLCSQGSSETVRLWGVVQVIRHLVGPKTDGWQRRRGVGCGEFTPKLNSMRNKSGCVTKPFSTITLTTAGPAAAENLCFFSQENVICQDEIVSDCLFLSLQVNIHKTYEDIRVFWQSPCYDRRPVMYYFT